MTLDLDLVAVVRARTGARAAYVIVAILRRRVGDSSIRISIRASGGGRAGRATVLAATAAAAVLWCKSTCKIITKGQSSLPM